MVVISTLKGVPWYSVGGWINSKKTQDMNFSRIFIVFKSGVGKT
jgi:hypothetical protein